MLRMTIKAVVVPSCAGDLLELHFLFPKLSHLPAASPFAPFHLTNSFESLLCGFYQVRDRREKKKQKEAEPSLNSALVEEEALSVASQVTEGGFRKIS